MAAEYESGDVLDGNVELIGQEMAETGGIENPGHAHHLVVGQAAFLAHDPDHGVEGVGDDDDEGLGAVFLDAPGDRGDDPGIDADQIIAAHARLAGHTGGDDDHV